VSMRPFSGSLCDKGVIRLYSLFFHFSFFFEKRGCLVHLNEWFWFGFFENPKSDVFSSDNLRVVCISVA